MLGKDLLCVTEDDDKTLEEMTLFNPENFSFKRVFFIFIII